MRKLLLLTIVFISLVYALILIYNTVTVFSKQTEVSKRDIQIEKESEILERFSRAIQIPVLSEESDSLSKMGMNNFINFLSDSYFELHKSIDLKIKEINKNLFLYRLKGRNEKLKPVLFVFKIDVKDPDLKLLTKWSYQPFSGKIEKGFIWGAGTMGDKSNCIALFEALENLLKINHQTQRSIFIAIVKEEPDLLKNNNLLADLLEQEEKFEMILGCKSFVNSENVLNLNKKIALINCTERSLFELEIGTDNLSNDFNPDKFSSINWKNNAVRELTETVAPELNFMDKFQICNYNLLGGIISAKFKKDKFLSDMLFDKVILNKFSKQNDNKKMMELSYFVSPDENYEMAKLKISNFFKTDDIKLKNSYVGYVTSSKNFSYEMLQSSVRQTFGDLIVLPGIGSKPTHMSVYKNLNVPIFNFSALLLDGNEKNRYETGIDERISVENYKNMIKFYLNLFSNLLN